MIRKRTRNVFTLHFTVWKGKVFEVVMNITEKAPLQGALLPIHKPRWRQFGGALAFQIIIVVVTVLATLFLPKQLETFSQHFSVTAIAAPPIKPWKPKSGKLTSRPMQHDAPTPQTPDLTTEIKSPIISPVLSSPVVKAPKTKEPVNTPDIPDESMTRSPNSLGESAIPVLKRPRENVQVGGFGNLTDLKVDNNINRHSALSNEGSFSFPSVARIGNGTAGHREVKESGFSDVAGAEGSTKLKPISGKSTNSIPVEIISKPKPKYTEAARMKNIEGEVLLQIVFSASGQIQVQRIVKGLGYGLDESAESSARQIRFKPAQQNGHSIDSTAIVHIVFELAY